MSLQWKPFQWLSHIYIQVQTGIELLVHPRVPPLVRSMPHLEALSLFKAEQSHEEAEILSSLAMEDINSREPNNVEQDVAMKDLAGDVSGDQQPTSTTPKTVVVPEPKVDIQPPKLLSESVHEAPLASPPSPAAESSRPTTNPVPREDQSSTIIVGNTSKSNLTPANPPSVVYMVPEADDEDQEMPLIDMNSDSEFEEDA